MKTLKSAGVLALVLAATAGLIALSAILITGTAMVGRWLLPFVEQISTALFIFSLAVLLPLSAFRRTRAISTWGLFIASYVFGLTVWLYGFLVTYQLWSFTGIVVGLFLGVVGVVPLGIIAAMLHGMWGYVAELSAGLVIAFGTRAYALLLARLLETDLGSYEQRDIGPSPQARRSMPQRIGRATWKSIALLVAILLGILGAAQAGWSGSALIFLPGIWTDGHAVHAIVWLLIGFSGAVALALLAFRMIAKWSLLLYVPIVLYALAALGIWNGIASDFDYTRGEAIKHGYANAYALRHMTARAFRLSCQDQRIALTEDAEKFCDEPSGHELRKSDTDR